jgi:hypothetical protein
MYLFPQSDVPHFGQEELMIPENSSEGFEGVRPLAGHYKSKSDFRARTFAKLAKVLPCGAQLVVAHLLVKDDKAVVELHSLATARNGLLFDDGCC